MVFRRRRSNIKRRIIRKRRAYRKKRMMRKRSGVVHIKRTSYAGNWTFDTVSTAGFWRYIGPDITAFNNFSEFANVFDEYKVNGIKWTFRPAYDSVQNISATTANQQLGQLQSYAHIVVDPGSTIQPTGSYGSLSLNTFLENDKVRTVTLNRPFSVYYRPKVLDNVFNTGTAAEVRRAGFIRTTETAAAFRGFHMYLQQNGMTVGNANIKLDLYVTFYVTFKNVK